MRGVERAESQAGLTRRFPTLGKAQVLPGSCMNLVEARSMGLPWPESLPRLLIKCEHLEGMAASAGSLDLLAPGTDPISLCQRK